MPEEETKPYTPEQWAHIRKHQRSAVGTWFGWVLYWAVELISPGRVIRDGFTVIPWRWFPMRWYLRSEELPEYAQYLKRFKEAMQKPLC